MVRKLLTGFATALILLTLAAPARSQLCGDVTDNGNVDIVDVVTLVNYIFDPTMETPAGIGNADMDPFPGIDVSDLTYLVCYMFLYGPRPCEGGPAGDDLTPGGEVTLEQVIGQFGPTNVAVGYPLTFAVRVTNNTDRHVRGMTNGFKLYSPDGANIGAIELSSGTLYEDLWFLEIWTQDPVAGEPFGNVAISITEPGMDPGYDGVAYQIEVEPFSEEDLGKTICFDSSYYAPAGKWMWAIDGQNTLLPSWDGPHCFTIEEAEYFPGDVDADGSVTVADLVDMVDYMFLNGEPPTVMDACDVNGSCGIPDISDLTYMVDFQFSGGTWPVFGCSHPSAKTAVSDGELALSTRTVNGTTVVTLTSDVELAGIQLTLAADTEPFEVSAGLDNRIDLVHSYDQGRLTVGILDLQGAATIAEGSTELLRVDGNCELIAATAADMDHHSLYPSLVQGKNSSLPADFTLNQNYPNPFNGSTVISFDLAKGSTVQLKIYDITGREVATLVDGTMPSGHHTVQWDGRAADGSETASGVYFYRLTSPGGAWETQKMVYLK